MYISIYVYIYIYVYRWLESCWRVFLQQDYANNISRSNYSKVKVRSNTRYSVPLQASPTSEALRRYMARTKQRHTYVPALYLPSRSRYSFTDHERMEG